MIRFQSQSFREQTHIVLALLGILPYLLFIYIVYREHFTFTQSILLVAAVMLVFHLGGYHILRTFSDALTRLVRRTRIVPEVDMLREIPVEDGNMAELAELTSHFNTLLEEIRDQKDQYREITLELLKQAKQSSIEYRRRITEGEVFHDRLKPYIGSEIADRIALGDEAMLRPEYRVVTVLFADIRLFTSFSEEASPDEVIEMLNEYFDRMVQIVYRYHGVLDKFIGDELMAVFGFITPSEQGPLDAMRTALEIQKSMDQLTKERESQGKSTFQIGIGINTGEVIAGSLGSRERMDYTVIGDTVNVASRLESLAKGGEILVGESMYRACRDIVRIKKRGCIEVKNRTMPVDCYVVMEE
jgi:class 3 adenylate cyclase